MKSSELPALCFEGIGKTGLNTMDDTHDQIQLQDHHIMI